MARPLNRTTKKNWWFCSEAWPRPSESSIIASSADGETDGAAPDGAAAGGAADGASSLLRGRVFNKRMSDSESDSMARTAPSCLAQLSSKTSLSRRHQRKASATLPRTPSSRAATVVVPRANWMRLPAAWRRLAIVLDFRPSNRKVD